MRTARLIRQQLNKTLREAAEATGIGEAALSRYEVGAGMREASETAYAVFLKSTVDEIRRTAPEPEPVPAGGA